VLNPSILRKPLPSAGARPRDRRLL
jgi:hypothetical protein